MALKGSEFVRAFANKGPVAWEAATLSLARKGELVPWPMVDLPLEDGLGHKAVIRVSSDVLAVGTFDDHVRLPLTPSAAQDVLNLTGALLPTPWLDYQIWRAAAIKIRPIRFNPNPGAKLLAYAQHDALIGESLTLLRWTPGTLAAGLKKSVVVSNLWKPGRVVIFGWYRPDGPDVFDDGRPMETEGRQPIQPLSNLHVDGYVDYSHGIRLVGPECTVDGQKMSTAELYRHPTLSRLVSNEGPVRAIRYPARVPPAANLPPPSADAARIGIVRDRPGPSDLGFDMITRKS